MPLPSGLNYAGRLLSFLKFLRRTAFPRKHQTHQVRTGSNCEPFKITPCGKEGGKKDFSTAILLTTRCLAATLGNVRYGDTTHREHFSLANSVQNCIYAAWSLERLGAARFLTSSRRGR